MSQPASVDAKHRKVTLRRRLLLHLAITFEIAGGIWHMYKHYIDIDVEHDYEFYAI